MKISEKQLRSLIREELELALECGCEDEDRMLLDTGADGEEDVDEVAPPGWEGTVKAMKKHKGIRNPWAMAWSMKNKGYKSHKGA